MPYNQNFTGTGDAYLERLVQACDREGALKAPLPGFGRALVPVASSWLEGTGSSFDVALERRPSGRPSANGGASVRSPGRHAPQQQQPRRHSISGGGAPAPAPAATPLAKRGRASLDVAPGGYACPSFAAAPKPEALPMPTSTLMTRALLRRSPSPPKCAA